MKTGKILSIAATLLASITVSAQDIHFSQMTQTPLLINPAHAGLGHKLSAYVNYKNQWRAVSANPYKTFNVSADMAFMQRSSGSHAGVGINVFSDKAGDGAMATTTGQLHLSGVIALNKNSFLSAGVYGGFGQRSLNYNNLYWDNQFISGQLDLTAPSGEPTTFANRSYADMGGGLAYYYGTGNNTISSNDAWNITCGVSAWHLNQPMYSYYGTADGKLPMKYVGYAAGEIGIKNFSLVVEPTVLFMMQGGHREINAGALFKYWMQEASVYTGRKKPVAWVLGGYYRFADAFNIVTGFEMYPFRVGFSYDVNLSRLTPASQSRGGFEVSLRFMMADDGKNRNKGFFN